MDKKGMTVSSTDSFFFQLYPAYFKVDHGFAKNMKAGCSYRIVIFKGLQKVDEMTEGIKGKLIGGKIVFEQTLLNFYLPIYTPTRNIQFAVKVFETKPNEPETEIAVHKIKSGDYIKTFKNEGTCVYRQEAQLLENFALVFDLFLHTSKIQLDQLVKQHQSKSKVQERSRLNNNSRTPQKGYVSQRDSQSDLSESGKDGNMFNSKKKLSRKRGHDGRLRSRHGSRDNSQISSREGSVRSEKKKLGPFPHAEQNEHFIHSPKKASPPKVEDNGSPQKSQPPSGKQNLVSVGRKDSNASQIHKTKQPQTPTKPARIESNIDRSQSAKKDSYSQRSNILPIETPIATCREVPTKRQQAKSPASNTPSKKQIHNLQVKGTQKIFQLQQKTTENKAEVFPPKNPISRNSANKVGTVEKTQPNVQADIESALSKSIPIAITSLNKNESAPDAKISKTQVVTQQKQEIEAKANEPAQNESSQKRAPSAKASLQSKESRSNIPLIAVKDRQVIQQQQRGVAELKLKQSMNMKRAASDGQNSPDQQVKKEFQSTRDKLFYVFFFVFSALLFYNAVTPSRKV